MKKAKEITDAIFKDPDGVVYKYPNRTCKDCIKYPCMKNMDTVFSSDFAKYGCTKYKDYTWRINSTKI